MRRRFLSILLAMALAVTSLDMTAYATEMENNEAAYTQEVEKANEADKAWAAEAVEERKTSEKIQEESRMETVLEGIDEENSKQTSIEVMEETAEIEKKEDVEKAQDENDANQNDNDNEDAEETGSQAAEVEEEDRSVEEAEIAEEIQTEEIMVGSSAELNAAVKNKIKSYETLYPANQKWDNTVYMSNGVNIGQGYKGWRQCCGFVVKMSDLIFNCYPTELRSASNNKELSNGWKCYYVTDKNYNSLVVEPGDVLDCPTSTQSNHTAMVLSVDNGKITCVQANINNNNLVYWTQCFNYNTRRSTLQNIYNDYASYIKGSGAQVFRLWKPSDTLKKNAKAYSAPAGESKLQITGQTPPGNGNLQVGSRWTCTGTISSNYTINEVSGYILASNNSTVLYSKTINPNATSYSLANGAIDIALLFNELPAGTYYYKITAKDTSGKTIAYNVKFIVSNPTPLPTPCSFSGKITSPVNGSTTETSQISVQATATDTYVINSFKISLTTGAYNKSVTANATKSGNAYVCSYNMDLPSYTTYTVTVDAVCANGATHRVGANTFTYKKKECSFSGQITSPVEGALVDTSNVKITASATDTYAINSFIVKLYNIDGITIERSEIIAAYKSGDAYICNYDFGLPEQKAYIVTVGAICENGMEHNIGSRYFTYDVTPPVISNLKTYEKNGDFYCSADVKEIGVGIFMSWLVIKDEGGFEKSFECIKGNDTVLCIWSDINGLWTSGKYTITLYVADYAGNKGYAVLQNVVIAEASTDEKKVYLAVGEEKEVNISVNTLFKTEGKNHTQKTDKGMKAVIKGEKPGCSKFSFEWTAKNNAFTTDHNYDIYVYTVPQAPKITKISSEVKGYDIITYEPVQYAKTYELYRKRIGIDADYQLWEEFTDNKSHSIIAEHADKNVVYYYRLRAKADEAIDADTNEKYYPTSNFSNDVFSEERGETEESSTAEESSIEESSTTEESNTTEESSAGEESSAEETSSSEDGDITDGLYISGLQTKTYTGNAIKQDIKVYYNKALLKEGKDYTLSYKNNTNVGNAILTIKAKGNLTGSVTKSFEIKPREITDRDVIIEDTVYVYDKKMHKKAPKVTYKGKTLKEKKDFEVSSYGKGNYTSVGTYTATIKGIGNFRGSFQNAKIIIVDKSKNISKATLAKIPVQEYQNGAEVELPDELLKVMIAKTELKKDIDYTVSYANNINPGKATLIIKGKGEYAGTKRVDFTIKRIQTALTEGMIVNKSSINTMKIQKNGTMPKPKLMSGNNTLIEDRDYVLSYKNNKGTGTGIVIIKGKGSYTGSLEMPFTITTKVLTSSDITIRVPNVPYTGKPNKYQSTPVLTDSDGGVLTKNKDYTIEAYQAGKTTLDKSSNPKEGTAITITIKGKGSYTGTAKATYLLEGIDFSKAVIKVASKSYTGEAVTIEATDIISATIKTGKTNTPLKLGADYEIAAYSNNLKKGTATVTFKGIGNYAGEKTVKFKITPSAISKQK